LDSATGLSHLHRQPEQRTKARDEHEHEQEEGETEREGDTHRDRDRETDRGREQRTDLEAIHSKYESSPKVNCEKGPPPMVGEDLVGED
jgi:hypothetical protein